MSRTVLNRIYAISLRVLCVLVLLIQSSLLNYYLIKYIDTLWFLWTVFDTAVTALFVASFVLSYRSVQLTVLFYSICTISTQRRLFWISCARHSKSLTTPYCRVLPPGEFNGMTRLFWKFYDANCNSRFTRTIAVVTNIVTNKQTREILNSTSRAITGPR